MTFADRSLVVAGMALLASCSEPSAPPAPDAEPSRSAVALPLPDPPLDRAGVLAAIGRAASAFASGRDDAGEQRLLDGRRFEVRLRFGCTADDAATGRWSYDAPSRVLKISVEPDIAVETSQVRQLRVPQLEAVEGFWLRRPWLLEPACPVLPAPSPSPEPEGDRAPEAASTPEPPAPAPRAGLAQFFNTDDSRTARRGDRAYQTTVQLDEGETPSADGYDLVLAGRLARLPGGKVVVCSGDGRTAPPACILSVTLDRVSVTRPGVSSVLAEWSRS